MTTSESTDRNAGYTGVPSNLHASTSQHGRGSGGPIYKLGPVFEGPRGALSAHSWIRQYEIHAKWMNWAEADMVEAIGMHLSGLALKWYSSTILEVHPGELCDMSWDTFKDKFVHRFEQRVEDPLVKWLDYKLDHNMEVANYFQEKIHLGNLARQDEGNQISGLTLGMPVRYKTAFATAGIIKDIHEWLAIAQKLEGAYKLDKAPTAQTFKRDAKPFVPREAARDYASKPAGSQGFSRPPMLPCSICTRKGRPDQHHWHNECPLKTVARVNAADGTERDSEPGNAEGSLDN